MTEIKVYQYPKYYKNTIYDLKLDIDKHINIDYNYLINEEYNRIYMNEDIYKLEDITKNLPKLNDITTSKRGIEGYKYKYSDVPNGINWSLFFTGQIYRYLGIFETKKWVELSGNEKSEYLDSFKGPRILIRRIISRKNRLQAMISDLDFIMDKDLYAFKVTDSSYNIKYLLALLNSTLFSYLYYMRSTLAQKDDFRQTTMDEIRQLPIIKADNETQQKIIDDVDKLIHLREEIFKLDFKDNLENYYSEQVLGKMELSKLIRWTQLLIAKEKNIIDKSKRYGLIYNIEVKQNGPWTIFVINGKEITDQNKEIELSSLEIFSILDLDNYIKEYIIHHLKKIKNINTNKKSMFDYILDLKLPMFDVSRPKNLGEIKQIIDSYNNSYSTFQTKMNDIRNLEAKIDAGIFKLYNLSQTSVEIILDSIGKDATTNITSISEVSLDDEYLKLILNYLK